MLGRGSGVKPVHAVGQRLAAQAEAKAAQQDIERMRNRDSVG